MQIHFTPPLANPSGCLSPVKFVVIRYVETPAGDGRLFASSPIHLFNCNLGLTYFAIDEEELF